MQILWERGAPFLPLIMCDVFVIIIFFFFGGGGERPEAFASSWKSDLQTDPKHYTLNATWIQGCNCHPAKQTIHTRGLRAYTLAADWTEIAERNRTQKVGFLLATPQGDSYLPIRILYVYLVPEALSWNPGPGP